MVRWFGGRPGGLVQVGLGSAAATCTHAPWFDQLLVDAGGGGAQLEQLHRLLEVGAAHEGRQAVALLRRTLFEAVLDSADPLEAASIAARQPQGLPEWAEQFLGDGAGATAWLSGQLCGHRIGEQRAEQDCVAWLPARAGAMVQRLE